MTRAQFVPELAMTEPGAVVTDLRAYATLAAAIADIGATPTTLLVSRDETCAAGTTTIPATTTIKFTAGSVLTIPTGATLAIAGKIDAPPVQIFNQTGTGAVTLTKAARSKLYPQYWGAVADGSTDDVTAIQAAVNSMLTVGGVLHFPIGQYKISTTITVNTTTYTVPIVFEGESWGGVVDSGSSIIGNFAGYMIDFQSVGEIGFRSGVRNLDFDGVACTLGQHGVRIGYVMFGFVEHCTFHWLDRGITLGRPTSYAGNYAYGTFIDDCGFLDTNVCVDLVNFIEATISNIQGEAPSHGFDDGGSQTIGTAVIYAEPTANCGYDSLKLDNIKDFSDRDYGIYVKIATGTASTYGRNHLGEWTNCIFEAQTTKGVYVEALITYCHGRLGIHGYYGGPVQLVTVSGVRITNSVMLGDNTFTACPGLKISGCAWNAVTPGYESTGIDRYFNCTFGQDSAVGTHRLPINNTTGAFGELAFPRGALAFSQSDTDDYFTFASNMYLDASGAWKAINTAEVALINIVNGGIEVKVATSTTADAAPSLANAFTVANDRSAEFATNLNVVGAVSKGSGSFKITHPLDESKWLYHSFIEGPKADLIYRGVVEMGGKTTTVNIDEVSNMAEGTFAELTQDAQVFVSNGSGWTPVRGSIKGNELLIETKTPCDDSISWMVVAERADQVAKDWDLTDDDGHLVPEWDK